MATFTRILRCAIHLEDLGPFRANCDKHGFTILQEDRASNGSIFQVEVPMKQADLFATWVKANYGDML